MTPLHLTMLLHYYTTPEPYAKDDPLHANSDAVDEYRENLLAWGLIQRDESSGSGYRTTERGEFLIDYIGNLPLPVQVWRMPSVPSEERHSG